MSNVASTTADPAEELLARFTEGDQTAAVHVDPSHAREMIDALKGREGAEPLITALSTHL